MTLLYVKLNFHALKFQILTLMTSSWLHYNFITISYLFKKNKQTTDNLKLFLFSSQQAKV